MPSDDTTAPKGGFDSPGDNPVATMPVAVIGTATDPSFMRYTLAYSPKGRNEWVTFATGDTPVVNGPLGTFDPTLLQNGFYDVRLTVEDTAGNVTTSDKVYVADGQAKIGNFTVAFDDLTIPAAGFPISLTRTYDSRNTAPGDFGNGWNLSVSNVQVTKSAVLGDGIYEFAQKSIQPGGRYGTFYGLASRNYLHVDITLPNGLIQSFEMGYVGIQYAQDGPPMASTQIFFQPRTSARRRSWRP